MGIALLPSTVRCQTEHKCRDFNINSLPPELLIQTFNFVAAIDALSMIDISFVCRKWYTIATKTPSIYQYIHLSDSPSNPRGTAPFTTEQYADQQTKLWRRNHNMAEVWMERSYPLPFDVFVEVRQDVVLDEAQEDTARDDCNLLGMLSPFYENLYRWRRIVVDDGNRNIEEFDFEEFFAIRSTPARNSLEFMNISICDLSVDDSLHNIPRGLFLSSRAASPMPILAASDHIVLTHIRPEHDVGEDKIAANYILSSLPQALVSSLHQPDPLLPYPIHAHGLTSITTLNISEHSVTLHTDPHSLLTFLGATPNLQNFTYVGWIHADRHAPASTLPTAWLPHLDTLRLRSTCLARPVLSCIHAPRLQNLELAHLNVDFDIPLPGIQIPGPDEEVGDVVHVVSEDGDSDDEANDFSQSPYSDRSTGMGLRTFFKRSNSPLKALYMDFTDMRTKDFIWLFPKLKHLEEFVIVASDMSDTVMRLLRPRRRHTYHRGWSVERKDSCGYDVHPDAIDVDIDPDRLDGPSTMILPKLKTLELYNCNRLSGDVIVDALVKRVEHADSLYRPGTPTATSFGTDEAADDDFPSTLGKVVIAGCDGFRYRHSQALLTGFRGRVRIVKFNN